MFGKIIGTVRSGFESGAKFNNTNWGFSENGMEVLFSFLSPLNPTLEEISEFLKVSKSSE